MSMSSTQSLAVLFADIAGSTRLYEELGDGPAKHLIGRGLAAMSERAAAAGGRLVKTIGDEILCTFPDATAAARAGLGMHEALFRVHPAKPLVAYVGLHWGEVIQENGDIFGDAVNVASRVVNLRRPRETLTTASTLNQLESDLRTRARRIDRVQLKGKEEAFEIYELVLETTDLTIIGAFRLPEANPVLSPNTTHLDLNVGGEPHRLDARRSPVTLGRLDHCDIVVPSTCTSRTHARIEYRGSRFVLIDQSSNGTFIQPDGDEGCHIVRDEIDLTGSGKIGFGAPVGESGLTPVSYVVTEGRNKEFQGGGVE